MRKVADQRWRAATARLRCERLFLAQVGKRHQAPHGRVLCYHSTGTPEWGVNDVAPQRFLAQIDRAMRNGYRFVPSVEVAAGRATLRDVSITFDDGLRSVLSVVPEMNARGIPFTVFVVTEWASQGGRFLSWADLEGLAAGGATIGSHSVTHANFRELTSTQRQDELERSRREISGRLGTSVEQFAIPFGRSADWDADCTTLAREAGYSAVFAQSEVRRPTGTVPRSFVTRFDGPREFEAILAGRFDHWEEWY